jgi:hypothetical protein
MMHVWPRRCIGPGPTCKVWKDVGFRPHAALRAGAQLVSTTFNVRGLSLTDQTRVVVRRHLDRLLVSLHRAVVSRLSRT